MEIRVRTDLCGSSFILPDTLQEDSPTAMAGANAGGGGHGGGPVVAPAAPEQPMPNPGAVAPASSSKHYRFENIIIASLHSLSPTLLLIL